jgi:pyroglutamyl-peptidase
VKLKVTKSLQIILSAFDPFNKAQVNQSQLVAVELEKLLESYASVETFTLPTVYDVAGDLLISKIELCTEKPSAVISLGEGDHRTRYESRAYNLDDCASVADNNGQIRVAQKIDSQSAEYFNMKKSVEKMGFPISLENSTVEISESAGRFVCNNLCYRVANYCDLRQIPFLFFHVPKHNLDEHVKDPQKAARSILLFLESLGIVSL